MKRFSVKPFPGFHFLALALCLIISGAVPAQKKKKYIVNAYVGGFRGLANVEEIDAEKLTHINYAFVNVQDSMAVLTNLATDSTNFRKLNGLKKKNPDLKIVISIGGWAWSENFSDAVLTESSRLKFAKSSVDIVRQYDLDGVDIDWEYPGEAGVPCVAGEVCARPDDKQNFVTLARELRAALDAAGTQDGKHYGITMAAGVTPRYVGDGQWLKDLAASLDWINLMTYDFHMPFEKTSNHLAPLFGDARDAANAGANTAGAVERYLQAGVARDKLVLGVPFYGYGWKGCPPGAGGDGQYQPCNGGTTSGINGGYSYGFDMLLEQGMLAPSLEGANGYRRYWNASARVPYLYNAAQQVWVSYEDPASLQEKARYIRQQGLRGAMFWEMSGDGQHRMLGALSQAMGK